MLLLQAPFDSIRGLQASNDLLVLDRLEDDLPTVGRKPVAIGIAILMLVLPTITPIPLVAAVLLAMVAVVATGCLRLGELQRSIRLDVILLLGSLTSFSVALQTTGLADALAAGVQQWLDGWPDLLRPRGDLPWNHPSHPSHEQRRLGRPVGPGGRATGSSPRALPFRPVNHRVVWGKPIIPHPRGISNQPDGVRPRQVSVPRCHSLRLRTHIDHDRIDPCADPLALRLILTNTGRTEA